MMTRKAFLSIAVALCVLLPQVANADLILYDGFDSYSGDIAGSGGGTGNWTGPWVQQLAGSTLDSTTGLTYGALTTVDGAAASTADVGSTNTQYQRTFDKATYFTPGSTVWMSVLLQRDGIKKFGITLSNTTTDYHGAGVHSINFGTDLVAGLQGTAGTTNANTAYTNNELLFAVARITIPSLGNPTVDAWINPSLTTDLSGIAVGGGDSTVTRSYGSLVSVDRVNVYSHNDNAINVDEIRVATTWAEVTPIPEPATLGLLLCGMGAMLRRRR
jgi:hypothetical protein